MGFHLDSVSTRDSAALPWAREGGHVAAVLPNLVLSALRIGLPQSGEAAGLRPAQSARQGLKEHTLSPVFPLRRRHRSGPPQLGVRKATLLSLSGIHEALLRGSCPAQGSGCLGKWHWASAGPLDPAGP